MNEVPSDSVKNSTKSVTNIDEEKPNTTKSHSLALSFAYS